MFEIFEQKSIQWIGRGSRWRGRLGKRHPWDPIRAGWRRITPGPRAFIDPSAHNADFACAQPLACGRHGWDTLAQYTLDDEAIPTRAGVDHFARLSATEDL